jgi:hypothetical protein
MHDFVLQNTKFLNYYSWLILYYFQTPKISKTVKRGEKRETVTELVSTINYIINTLAFRISRGRRGHDHIPMQSVPIHLWCLWVQISIRARCTTLCDNVCQWLATGRWFSLGPPFSSTNKTDRHDIAEILLKVAFNTIKPNQTEYWKWITNYWTSWQFTNGR